MLKQDFLHLMALLVTLVHTLGILSAIHAVAGVRTPQGAIAWAISLLTFPYAGGRPGRRTSAAELWNRSRTFRWAVRAARLFDPIL